MHAHTDARVHVRTQDREPGPPFKALSEDEVRNKKLMRSMKEAGLSGTM